MTRFRKLLTTSLVAVVAMACLLCVPIAVGAADQAAVDKAFETLKTYDWGDDRGPIQALDEAVAASYADDAARKGLETRLVALLKTDAPTAAKDSVCRQLSMIGSADSAAALGDLLTDKDLSHMGRYALERMPCPEAVAVLRDAMAKTDGLLKVGVINSLGVRRDAESVSALTALVDDSNQDVAAAAVAALGAIGNTEAAKVLTGFQAGAPEKLQLTAADACLACAEHLLADGKKIDAMKIYTMLKKADVPKHVQVAAARGLLAVMGKK